MENRRQRPEEFQPYFRIHHGQEAWLKDMPMCVTPIIALLLREGEAVGQYALPFGRPEGDMRIWMPKRVKERADLLDRRTQRINEEREKLTQRGI